MQQQNIPTPAMIRNPDNTWVRQQILLKGENLTCSEDGEEDEEHGAVGHGVGEGGHAGGVSGDPQREVELGPRLGPRRGRGRGTREVSGRSTCITSPNLKIKRTITARNFLEHN